MTTIVARDKRPVLSPSTPGATAETVALYNYIQSLTGTSSFLFGHAEYMSVAGSKPNWSNYQEQFRTMSGKYPAMVQFEYVDTNHWDQGSACNSNMIERIKDVYRSGGICKIHHHPGNPVTGSLASNVPVGGGSTGNYADRNGSPVAACLSGGAQRAQFLAYCDRWAATLNALQIGGVKIPVIVRPFHEINAAFFWWNGADRRADMVQMWRDFVDRLRAQGVTNALFELNFDCGATDSGIVNWNPGDTYFDLVSGDYYDGRPNPVFPYSSLGSLSSAANYTTMLGMGKPVSWSEVGYNNTANRPGQWAKQTGAAMRLFPACWSMLLWIPYGSAGTYQGFAPVAGQAVDADVAAMLNDPRCITRERVTFRPFAV